MNRKNIDIVKGQYPLLDLTRVNDRAYMIDYFNSEQKAVEVYRYITRLELLEKMKPLYITDSGNWNYYYDPDLNCTWYIAKTNECESGIFGNLTHFRRWLKREIDKDESIIGKLTALAFKILKDGKAA